MIIQVLNSIKNLKNEEASKILKNHAPKNLKDQYGQLAFIKYKLDVMACIVEEMVRKQYLQVPEEKSTSRHIRNQKIESALILVRALEIQELTEAIR